MRPFTRCSLLAALIISSLSPAVAADTQTGLELHTEKPLWLRNTALSPDGKQLAFTYQSRIYLVSSDGGHARAITNGEFYPHALVWSPDNTTLAFAANPYGNDDVFTVSLETGQLTRLTYHSAADIPTTFTDNGDTVLFNTTRLSTKQQDFYSLPAYSFGSEGNQLYSVDIKEKAAHALLPIPAKNAIWNGAKTQLLYNSPHKDQPFRKHQTSFAAPNIWLFDAATGQHQQLTESKVAAQRPFWNRGNTGFYYLSERSGNFNVWFYDLATNKETQITSLTDHPIRHLSVSENGDLAFSYNGELYRLEKDQTTPKKLDININSFAVKQSQFFHSDSATHFMPSAFDADELLFNSYGDIYAMNVRSSKVKKITHSATEEKQMTFTPDGYGVMYSAMRNGRWGLYIASSASEEEMLSNAPVINEQPFLVLPDHDISQPVYSPDGLKLAFVVDGRALHVVELDAYDANTPVSSLLSTGPSLLSTDHDAKAGNVDTNTRPNTGKELIAPDMVSESNRLEFVWSPDSTQLAVHLSPRPYVEQIYVVDAEGKKPAVNVSQSGFYNGKPKWSQDNRILTWTTSKYGLKTADGEDWDETVTGIFTNSTAMKNFKDDRELPEEVESYPFSARNIEYRDAFHLPFSTVVLETHLLDDELLVIDLVASPSGEETTRGFIYNLRTEESYPVFSDLPMATATYITADQSYAYLLSEGEVTEIDIATGDSTRLPIELPVDYQEEPRRLAAYRQFVRQTQDLYYRPNMGNVDWAFYSSNYQRFLPHINNNRDFADLLKELSGELNASHTGAFADPDLAMREDATADLGLIFNQHKAPSPSQPGTNNHNQADGLIINGILPGGPADNEAYVIQQGDRLIAVNNTPVQTLADLAIVLNNKAAEPVELTLQHNNDNTWYQRITPIDGYDAYSLIQKRWEIARRNYVTQKTNGKVGYVYLPDMSNAAFLHLRSEALGRLRNTEVLIVDVRFNGGGFLADTLIEFLTARKVADIVPHVGKPASDASRRSWLKPSVVIANSASYSEASAFSQYYKDLNVGPIVGEPVPGTGTTVMGVESQVYKGIGYMFPYQPLRTVDGKLYENLELQPDVKVFNSPSDVAVGRDRQLDAAIEEALKQI